MKNGIRLLALFLGACLFGSFSVFAQDMAKSLTWQIKSTGWSPAHEKAYQEFVTGIGMAREQKLCGTVDQCLKHPVANRLYYQKNPKELRTYSDCADLPFVLRAYFAWMNNLPFAYPNDVAKANDSDAGSDIRYTPNGNKINGHYIVKTGDNFNKIIANLSDSVSSAMFRIHPQQDVIDSIRYPDFSSVKLTRQTLLPGTALYDPAGHILVVYKVENDGRILLIDAHPDGSLTRQVYGDKFVRSRPAAGAGFKAFRPIQLIDASLDSNGNYVGGKISATPNAQISSYGFEQYVGTTPSSTGAWSKGTFELNGEVLDYYDYVRRVLATGNLKYNPLVEMKEMMRSVCDDLQDRKTAVDSGVASGMSKRSHPVVLPDNIYGTSGDWESFSSPSRDARFKAAVREIRNTAQVFIEKEKANDPIIVYEGNDLGGELLRIYNEESSACSITYKKTNGQNVTLNLDQVIERLFALSFDPYHCIELRWGATSSDELVGCPDDTNKVSWYKAEQSLRNAIDRNYDVKMNKSLNELPSSGLGAAISPDVDIKGYLRSEAKELEQ